MGYLLPSSSPTQFLVAFIAFLLLIEQLIYWKKKRRAPGPLFVLPFLGNAISLIRQPTKFWEVQADLSSRFGFSTNYIIGRFMVFIRSSELSHLIFHNVRPDAFMLVGHPFGKKLFGEHNLIYMFGQDHKNLRGLIAPNFTPKALSTYISLQQTIILKHLKKWVNIADSKPMSLRLLVREMNLETSQTVFVGPYLDEKARVEFNEDYNLFNVGLMTLPIDLPGFAFRTARVAVERLVNTLGLCTKQSKAKMVDDQEPSCLIDFWMQEIVKYTADGEAAEMPQTSNNQIGGHLFDFLFAAQDASTSSLLWAITLLESHPDVLSRVRSEVLKFWSPESDEMITADQIREMKYTQAVAREVIRYRAPATLVPHIAMEDFPLTDWYTIPKGTIVFPSVFESSFQGFTDGYRFDPDRFSEDRQEDQVYKKNFLAFGAGPHQCVGQRYALNHLVLFIAMFTTLIDFKRHRTDGCDDIVYYPTICPKDGCLVYLSKRCTRYPNFSSE
ncbi:hypothetical protein Q3G72_031955 [Acer saccharum]|nr:hypothetical protein Q3G72_031955 [Acer saccharum]